MAGIKEHDYLKVCAQLASCLSISISAAKKKLDLIAAKKGVQDFPSRKKLAQEVLKEARESSLADNNITAQNLDNLLEALAEEENFMVED